MYRELLSIHRQLDRIEKMIIPTEHITEEENRELDELEADTGDTIPWEETRRADADTKRVKKAATETDALRTPSTPGWNSTEEIRRWREARR